MSLNGDNKFNLEEEVICDHIVTKKVKKLWAAEMDLAMQLKKVCTKHGIKYYAAGGTLLGAVRHQGFIPWDDDMDFLMMQEDYEKFCKIAPLEIHEPYCFQQSFSLSRIRNSNTTGCTKTEIDNAIPPFNFGIFIDIFPLFALPDNKVYRKLHKLEIFIMRAARRGERRISLLRYHNKLTWRSWLNWQIILWKIITFFGEKDMTKRYLRLCSKYCGQNTKEVGITAFLPYNNHYIWEKEWFEGESVELPFENITIPAPHDYEAYLKKSFGDYTKYVKNGAQHMLPIFDADKPFKQYIEEIKEQQIAKEK